MVDFKMVDINGQYRHVTIPAENFSEETMKYGIGFDASNYGYAVVEKSDMVFIPDPDTAMIDPFCTVPTLTMTGNAMIIDTPENRPLPQYPRNIVLAAEKYMQDLGIADTMLILPEFEFYLFDNVGWEVSGREIGFSPLNGDFIIHGITQFKTGKSQIIHGFAKLRLFLSLLQCLNNILTVYNTGQTALIVNNRNHITVFPYQ